jgi:hypothetical protein
MRKRLPHDLGLGSRATPDEPDVTLKSTMKVTMQAMRPMTTDCLHRRAHRRLLRRQNKIMHAMCAVQNVEQVPRAARTACMILI